MPLLAILVIFAFTFVPGVFAQGKPVIKVVPIKYTPPTDGSQMFKEYCASCHGITGEGNGPAAAALKKVPGNLTRLSERNNGKFPSLRVASMIRGLEGIDAHGTREMPIWGSLFRSLGPGSGPNHPTEEIRISSLIEYLKSIQRL